MTTLTTTNTAPAPADETIQLRIDMIDGRFDLDSDTVVYMNYARKRIQELAKELNNVRPANFDNGRFIAAIDHLQQAKNLFCDAAILGDEAARRRKKRAIATESSTGGD